MARGLPYDSDEGRAYAAAITAIMTGRALPQVGRGREAHGPARGLRGERSCDARRDLQAPGRGRQHPAHRLGARRHAVGGAQGLGRRTQPGRGRGLPQRAGDGARADRLPRRRQPRLDEPRPRTAPQRSATRSGSSGRTLDIEVSTDEGPAPGDASSTSTASSRSSRSRPVAATGSRARRRTGSRSSMRTAPGSGAASPRSVRAIACRCSSTAWSASPSMFSCRHSASSTGRRTQRTSRTASQVTPELAELVGYFMGDGSLHAKGLRFCVAARGSRRRRHVSSTSAGRSSRSTRTRRREEGLRRGCIPLGAARTVVAGLRLREAAAGADHRGKGWVAHIPDAILHTNDREVYAAFVRGLFEADGTTNNGYVVLEHGDRELQPRRPEPYYSRSASSRPARSTARARTGATTSGSSCGC